MAQVLGIKELQRNLTKLATTLGPPKTSVVVGYTASYAIYVHEMPMKHPGKKRLGKGSKGRYWDPQGRRQNKFLESAARDMDTKLSRVMAEVFAKTGSMTLAVKAAGLRLQRESQLRVPVDKGFLKSSAFTRVEK